MQPTHDDADEPRNPGRDADTTGGATQRYPTEYHAHEPHQRGDAGYESPGADTAGGARRSRPEEAYADYDQHSCTRPHTS